MSSESAPTTPITTPSAEQPRAKVLIYKLGNKMAYVGRQADYKDALALAKETYPALKQYPDERIAFKILAQNNHVLITPSAWAELTLSIASYQTVHIVVHAAPKITVNDGEPPAYDEFDEKSSQPASRASSRSPRIRALNFLSKLS